MPKVNRNRESKPREKEPQMNLAICEEDLERIDPIVRANTLKHRLDLEHPFRVFSNSNEIGVVFVCRLLDAAIICDIIRSEDRKGGDIETRIYIQEEGRQWQRVGKSAVFAVTVGGKLVLNPKLFQTEIVHKPLLPQVVEF